MSCSNIKNILDYWTEHHQGLNFWNSDVDALNFTSSWIIDIFILIPRSSILCLSNVQEDPSVCHGNEKPAI